jgi:hypothetical protein
VGAVFAELAHFFLFQDPEGFSGKICGKLGKLVPGFEN